jgi:hypothetical protein
METNSRTYEVSEAFVALPIGYRELMCLIYAYSRERLLRQSGHRSSRIHSLPNALLICPFRLNQSISAEDATVISPPARMTLQTKAKLAPSLPPRVQTVPPSICPMQVTLKPSQSPIARMMIPRASPTQYCFPIGSEGSLMGRIVLPTERPSGLGGVRRYWR